MRITKAGLGIEPDIALVKYKQLAGGGMLKIVNNTVPAALKKLGYDQPTIESVTAYIDKNDTIYVADSASDAEPRTTDGWKRGIRIGSARDGSVKSFIPDPVEKASITSAAEGVVVDANGNLYGAEVGPRTLTRYVKK